MKHSQSLPGVPSLKTSLPFLLGFLLCIALPVAAQEAPGPGQGVIEGRVTSTNSGQPVTGALVTVSGTDLSSSTDSEGNFRIVVPAGSHELIVEKGGFSASVLPDIDVQAGRTVTRNRALKPEIEQLVVMGRAVMEGSVASSLSEQQDATSVIEVIGSEEFSRLGDSSAADTLQRMTGLNVEDGKYVVIRGQPQRYTSTLFNNSQMPSLDPIQSVTPLDLFPSGVLSNIAVQKVYTADRPGSFGSGQVQLSTTGLPAEDFLELKAGSGVNFQSIDEEPLEFNTGDDIFGNVNSTLELPAGVAATQAAGTPIATLPSDERISLAQSFSDELAPGYMDAAGPDMGLSLTGGKRFDTDFGTFGASLTFAYDQKVRTEDEERRVLRLGNQSEIEVQDDSVINRTKFTTGLGGLLAMTGEWDRHEVKSNTFWVRDTIEETELNEGVFRPSDEDYLRRFLLEFEQREMFIQQLTGSHSFDFVNVDWRGLISEATRELPDRREFSLQNTELDGSGSWFVDNIPLDRRWNSVDEDTFSGGIDLSFPVSEMFFADAGYIFNLEGGVDGNDIERTSETRLFQFVANPADGNRFLPVEQLYSDDRIASGEVSLSENAAADDYTADIAIRGSYVQVDFELPQVFRVVAGVRFEEAEYNVQTFQAAAGTAVPVNSGFYRRDELPSLVGSWFINDDMQLRAGVARSLAYPTPVEISDTTFIDPDSNEGFIGNPDLEPVIIDSYDLRWEWYPSRAEALTLGIFYKDMTDPIERRFTSVAGGGDIVTFVNAEEGEVMGVELNGRVDLSRLRDAFAGPDWLNDMHIGGNIAYQDSEVTLGEGGAETNPVRRMTGQPEFMANLEFGYTGDEHIMRIAAGYTSDRLINAGIQGLPDEFIDSRFSLGGKWSYNPAYLRPLTVSLELENLLDDEYRRTQGGIITRSYTGGVTGSLSFKWRFGGT